MQIPVLIERLPGNGYRASGGNPFGFTALGTTREEALSKLQEAMRNRLDDGAELIKVDVGPTEHPLAPFAGIWQEGDPLIEEWKKAVEEYRQEIDQEPDVP
jgi:predicted RNase H-like HicB family nuclease